MVQVWAAAGFAAATSLAGYAFYLYVEWRQEVDLIPGPKVMNWFVGNQPEIGLAGGFAPFLVSLHQEYGSIARYWEGPFNSCISVNDPEILRFLGVQKWEKRVEGLNFMRGLFGDSGIAFLKGHAAKERRNLIFQIFNRQPFETLLPHWINSISAALSRWSEEKSEDSLCFTLDVQNEVRPIWAHLNQYNVFGDEVGTYRICQLFADATKMLVRIRYCFSWLSFLGISVLPFSSLWWEKRKLLASVHAEMDRLIETRLQGGCSLTESDLLTLLLREPLLSRQEVM